MRLSEQEGIAQRLDVSIHGVRIRLYAKAVQGSGNAAHAGNVPDVVEEETCDSVNEPRVGKALPLEDILDEDGIVDAVEVVADEQGITAERQRIRE